MEIFFSMDASISAVEGVFIFVLESTGVKASDGLKKMHLLPAALCFNKVCSLALSSFREGAFRTEKLIQARED